MHNDFEYVEVNAQLDKTADKIRYYVDYWPERIRVSKRVPNECDYANVDENVVHFTVDNGIARYYIIKGLEDSSFWYAKKFYSFQNPYHH